MVQAKLHLNEQRELGISTEHVLPEVLVRYECPECGRLLAKADLRGGSTLEIKCPKCKTICRRMAL
jgi:predicted RNA-binding Zn-ribbon protein involved in translation (DUF1610 family)